MIEIQHLSKSFQTPTGVHEVLSDVSLSVLDGEIYGIIGESGAGKSTLVRCINLLERPTSGKIIIDGQDITALSERELLKKRRDIGMIFQNFSLMQQRTVLRNVTFPLELQHADRKESEARAFELLEMVGLGSKANCYPSQLSGGQQQRVAIARALASRPSIMLCDEATSALDTMTTQSILALLKDINREMGVSIVLITHSMAVAEHICDRVAVIEGGVIVERGDTKDVFSNPQAEITKALLGFEYGAGGRS